MEYAESIAPCFNIPVAFRTHSEKHWNENFNCSVVAQSDSFTHASRWHLMLLLGGMSHGICIFQFTLLGYCLVQNTLQVAAQIGIVFGYIFRRTIILDGTSWQSCDKDETKCDLRPHYVISSSVIKPINTSWGLVNEFIWNWGPVYGWMSWNLVA